MRMMTQKAWERGRDWAEMREGCIPWCAAGLRLFSAPAWRITAFTLQLKNSPVIIYLAGVSLSALCSWRRTSSAWDWYTSTNLSYKCRTLDFQNIITKSKITMLVIVIKKTLEIRSVIPERQRQGRVYHFGAKIGLISCSLNLAWRNTT